MPRGMTNKLFTAICAVGMFLVIALGFAVTIISRNLLYQDVRMLLDNQAKQTVTAFDQSMDILKNSVMTASRQSSIKDLISGRFIDGFASYLAYRDAYAYLKNVHESYDWMHLYVLVKEKQYIMSSNPADVTGNYKERGIHEAKWYAALEDSLAGVAFRSDFIPPASSSQEHFAYALKVRNVYTWSTEGYIIASIQKAVLRDLLRGTSLEDNGFLLVLTEDGQVAYNSNPELFGRYFTQEQIRGELQKSSSNLIRPDRRFYYSSFPSYTTGWDFIIFADITYGQRHIVNFQITVFLIVLTAVLLLIITARLIANANTKPVRRLIEFIHGVEKNEFAEQIDLKAEDEMAELVDSFNAMILSVRENQILRKRSQIYALQKQINPHFLYNTFESIKSLAQLKDNRGVIAMIEKLSDLFHYNTDRSGKPMTGIRDELQHIMNYLDIQRVRFGSRLEVNYVIDEKVLLYLVPRVILQPIVENSICHSMERMKAGYRLDISAGFDGADIQFVIRDNGIGIFQDKLQRLAAFIRGEEGTERSDEFGIGLKNIHERLVLSYGSQYGISISSEAGVYTEVRVRIPKVQNTEEGPL